MKRFLILILFIALIYLTYDILGSYTRLYMRAGMDDDLEKALAISLMFEKDKLEAANKKRLELYKKIFNEQGSSMLQWHQTCGDGNCFFHGLKKILQSNGRLMGELDHKRMRAEVINYMRMYSYLDEETLDELLRDGAYVGEEVVQAAANLYNININVFSEPRSDSKHTYLRKFIGNKDNNSDVYWMEYSGGRFGHYSAVVKTKDYRQQYFDKLAKEYGELKKSIDRDAVGTVLHNLPENNGIKGEIVINRLNKEKNITDNLYKIDLVGYLEKDKKDKKDKKYDKEELLGILKKIYKIDPYMITFEVARGYSELYRSTIPSQSQVNDNNNNRNRYYLLLQVISKEDLESFLNDFTIRLQEDPQTKILETYRDIKDMTYIGTDYDEDNIQSRDLYNLPMDLSRMVTKDKIKTQDSIEVLDFTDFHYYLIEGDIANALEAKNTLLNTYMQKSTVDYFLPIVKPKNVNLTFRYEIWKIISKFPEMREMLKVQEKSDAFLEAYEEGTLTHKPEHSTAMFVDMNELTVREKKVGITEEGIRKRFPYYNK